MTTPIFLLSLPRSGSTLLQRLIATHPEVATASEPWLLLPLLAGFREGDVFATYRQRYLVEAFEDFLGALPEGESAYREAVRAFASTLYERACLQGESYFLDKTPRYHLIADELLRTFPDARFILLWRNPLAVAASCIEIWGGGRWCLHSCRADLGAGLDRLIEVQRQFRDRMFVLRYEDLVAEPQRILDELFESCGLTTVEDAETRFRDVLLPGRMGDPSRVDESRDIGPGDESWPSKLASPPRRAWARGFLRRLGRERLAEMGYDADELNRRLAAEPVAWGSTLSDLLRMAYDRIATGLELELFRRRKALARKGLGADAGLE